LKAEGTTPEVSEVFMARVIEGETQSMIVQRRDTGMGSAGDELRLLARTNLQVSAMDILLKLENVGGDGTSVPTRLQAGVMLDRIFSIFSTKYDEKCWQASGVLGAVSFFPLFNRKLTVLKAVLESPLFLLNFL
jgi:hypothetical protein